MLNETKSVCIDFKMMFFIPLFSVSFSFKKGWEYSKSYILAPLSIEKRVSTVFLRGFEKFEFTWFSECSIQNGFFNAMVYYYLFFNVSQSCDDKN